MQTFLGIDPGWKNLGLCLTDINGKVLETKTINSSELPLGSIPEVLSEFNPLRLSMERFVYYHGKHNPDSEHILMVTGQIQYWAYSRGIPFDMYRAIDWKQAIVKHLAVNLGQKNPYDRLDKRFSLWAAKIISGYEHEEDHEADANILSFIGKERWKRMKS